MSENDFAIALDNPASPAGKLTFQVTNGGPSAHEFVVFRTDSAEDQLPTGQDGRIVEEGPGLTKAADSGTDLAPNSTRSITTTLAAGRYVLVCNLPGHYKAGMHTTLVIS